MAQTLQFPEFPQDLYLTNSVSLDDDQIKWLCESLSPDRLDDSCLLQPGKQTVWNASVAGGLYSIAAALHRVADALEKK